MSSRVANFFFHIAFGQTRIRAKDRRFLSENLDVVRKSGQCKKSAVQQMLYFALRASELPAHGAKGGL